MTPIRRAGSLMGRHADCTIIQPIFRVLSRFQRNIVDDCEAMTDYDISALRNVAKTFYDLVN